MQKKTLKSSKPLEQCDLDWRNQNVFFPRGQSRHWSWREVGYSSKTMIQSIPQNQPCTVHPESIHNASLFSTFCYVTALFQNGINIFFSSKFYTQYPIMTTWKKFLKFIKNKKQRNHMYMSIHSLCSILCWCTFGSNYSLKSFWIWCHKLSTPIFG